MPDIRKIEQIYGHIQYALEHWVQVGGMVVGLDAGYKTILGAYLLGVFDALVDDADGTTLEDCGFADPNG